MGYVWRHFRGRIHLHRASLLNAYTGVAYRTEDPIFHPSFSNRRASAIRTKWHTIITVWQYFSTLGFSRCSDAYATTAVLIEDDLSAPRRSAIKEQL
jgi:hypothetical protein